MPVRCSLWPDPAVGATVEPPRRRSRAARQRWVPGLVQQITVGGHDHVIPCHVSPSTTVVLLPASPSLVELASLSSLRRLQPLFTSSVLLFGIHHRPVNGDDQEASTSTATGRGRLASPCRGPIQSRRRFASLSMKRATRVGRTLAAGPPSAKTQEEKLVEVAEISQSHLPSLSHPSQATKTGGCDHAPPPCLFLRLSPLPLSACLSLNFEFCCQW